VTQARRGPGRPRDPHADDQIMKAALELFVERGLEGANFEQIAKRAGVAKVTVYRRWSSREELLVQAIEQARTVAPEAEIWASADDPPRDERLLASWTRTFGDTKFRAVLAQLIGASVSHPSLLATYREHYLRPRRAAVHAALDREGDADVDTVIDMVVGAAMYRMLIDPDGVTDPRQYLTTLIRHADRLLRDE
jgi:AcrR family transcriptional regulator